jgi:hypothetical protein
MKIRTLLFLAAALCCRGSVFAGEQPAAAPLVVSLSLDGSLDRYGGVREEELRAGVEFECASGLKLGRAALDWNLELYYGHSRSDTDGEVTTTDSAGLDLAKILLSSWGGAQLETARPYLLAGVELTRLREPSGDEDGGTASSRYLSPTVGLGLEFKLNRRASLNAEYRQNLSGGERRISGVTLGLTYAIFGADEEDDDEGDVESGQAGKETASEAQ